MDVEGNKIDEKHRKELLRFFLVKTAATRRGVKPAELLRVRHCYSETNPGGLRICLYRSDIYGILGLDYLELKVEERSSLALFYNPSALEKTLSEPRNARWLERLGYPVRGTLEEMLETLKRRAESCPLPHEVGVFIGYPLKDVAGFMRRIPSTPIHGASWRVYGSPAESIRRMRLYKAEEAYAAAAFGASKGVDDFIRLITLKNAG